MLMRAECRGCGKSGAIQMKDATDRRQPAWCQCRGIAGPFTAPPGKVVRFSYMMPEQAADLEATRAITNEYIAARDAGADARWTPAGRARGKSTAIYRAWSQRMLAAERALDTLQAACPHPERSMFSLHHCHRCGAYLGKVA